MNHKSNRCENVIRRKDARLIPVYAKIPSDVKGKRTWISLGKLCPLCLVVDYKSGISFATFEMAM